MTGAPIVLCIAGHDPLGLAGIHADIETCIALDARPVSLVTAQTAQNNREFRAAVPADPGHLVTAFELLAADTMISGIKVGYLPDAAVTAAAADVLDRCPGIPVVVDPVLTAAADDAPPAPGLVTAIRDLLLPRATIVTPNRREAAWLCSGAAGAATDALRALGALNVVVTGGDSTGDEVVHAVTLAGADFTISCRKLPGRYRGSGCTFSSALAVLLARGEPLELAVRRAHAYTYGCLLAAEPLGGGFHRPDRFSRRWEDVGQ